MENLTEKINLQIGSNPSNGIYEVFVTHQDYCDYFELGVSSSPNMNQKMYAVVWNGEVSNLCLSKPKAWAEFKQIAEDEGIELI